MGVSDLYGDSIEGNDPSRGWAALGGIPYAAMETVPEYLAALRFFKGLGMKAAKAGGKLGRAGTIGTNVGIGIGTGAVLEGATELGQEVLGIGMNAELDYDSPEGLSRLLNAFAAGAASVALSAVRPVSTEARPTISCPVAPSLLNRVVRRLHRLPVARLPPVPLWVHAVRKDMLIARPVWGNPEGLLRPGPLSARPLGSRRM
jgi:hypothetical protein